MKTFDELFKESIEYDVIYGNGLSNHLPMALLSLKELDSDLAHINDFSTKYSKKLQSFVIESKNRVNEENWIDLLGREDHFDDFLSFFNDQIKKIGHQKVIETYLPTLATSPVSAAFHCAIRAAYILQFKKFEDLAMSLAYWASMYLEIPRVKEGKSSIEFHSLNMDYIEKYKKNHEIPLSNIGVRAKYAMGTSEFEELFNQLGFDNTLDEAHEFSLSIMNETLDFTALHLITGTHAMKEVFKFLDEDSINESLKTLMPSLIAAFLSMTKASRHNKKIERASLEEVKKIGATSFNDHVIKLSFVALEEFKRSNNQLYLDLAKAYSP